MKLVRAIFVINKVLSATCSRDIWHKIQFVRAIFVIKKVLSATCSGDIWHKTQLVREIIVMFARYLETDKLDEVDNLIFDRRSVTIIMLY